MKFYDSQNYTAVSFSQSFSIFHHDMVNLSYLSKNVMLVRWNILPLIAQDLRPKVSYQG